MKDSFAYAPNSVATGVRSLRWSGGRPRPERPVRRVRRARERSTIRGTPEGITITEIRSRKRGRITMGKVRSLFAVTLALGLTSICQGATLISTDFTKGDTKGWKLNG